MLAKCANPYCEQAFRYLREGKLFFLDTAGNAPKSEKSGTTGRREHLEYFWLCARCSGDMSVLVNDSGDVVLSGLQSSRPDLILRPAA